MSRRKLFLRRHSNSQKLLLDHRLWNLGNEIDDIKFQPAIIALKNNARPIGLDVPKGIDLPLGGDHDPLRIDTQAHRTIGEGSRHAVAIAFQMDEACR